MRIDLNADMGEGFGVYPLGRDAELLAFVTSANVACGFHAGDPAVMDRTVGLAVNAGVAVGAHPGFPDLRGFGRRRFDADADDVERDVLYQVGALQAFARAHGTRVAHVKPHGALYNQRAHRSRRRGGGGGRPRGAAPGRHALPPRRQLAGGGQRARGARGPRARRGRGQVFRSRRMNSAR